ncbi:DNA replication and repair protein RecF [Hartmannibacter diazotrophicus]|uniref:DNA replication and repair protein RecF n=1 Tax=Hartmannibacter diazotrophicus TaxID=1482074 RepID=A0A2C9CZX2_9HYPH|nr:DNA replication/repair protein RecF [Hartmannibacter diazotrophicus]SON53544.1 DNA replication and repair protein RecF [Hartmannibacter diazotrophicus]
MPEDNAFPELAVPGGICPVRLTALKVADFRNYASAAIEVASNAVVLVGPNGAGKTNLLEAISYLSPGRGLRRARLGDVARIGGAGGWAVATDVEGAVGPARIGTGLVAGEATRQVRIDGTPQKGTDILSDHLRVMWLTPAMDGLFTGPASDRRRFLDRLVLSVDPAHGRRVAAFEQALTGRNRLLEDHRTDPAWLDATEAQIAELGVAVAAARGETVACLARLADETGPAGEAFPRAGLTLEGDLEAALAKASASEVEDWYLRDLAAARSRDRAAGRTLVGPHRSDLAVTYLAKAMPAALSSTGEQKALLIGLVLAHARLVTELARMTPLLLLDEITAHLDPGRREALAGLIDEIGTHAFLTGTDPVMFEAFSGRQVIEAVDGTLRSLDA